MKLNTNKIELSAPIKKLIDNLHNDKLAINSVKLKNIGTYDNDDQGFVCFPEYKFEPIPNHKEGFVYGYRAIGENLRKFFNDCPKYVNKNSALGGCWVGFISDFMKLGVIPEDRCEKLDAIWKEYKVMQPGFGSMNHCGPDITIGLLLGWGGLLNKLRYYRDQNVNADPEFYYGEEQLILGIQEWIRKNADLAFKMAEAETDEFYRQNLIDIGNINIKLIDNPPTNLREACQFIAHFQSVDRTYLGGGALAQLDEVLRPYYNRDIKNGILTDELAVWYISSLFFNDTHYSQIGGVSPDGKKDITSRMSFIILEAMNALNIPINVAIRVHDNINSELMHRSLEYNIANGSGVDYSMEIGCTEGYAKNGYAKEVCRTRAKVGCNWTALPGREYPFQDVTRCNFAIPLVRSLEDISQSKNYSMEELWYRFVYHTKVILDSIKEGYDLHYEVIANSMPEIVLNLFMHGPVESGLNAASGGVAIQSFCIDGIALATVADSFAAVEQRIFNEKKISFEKLIEVLNNNYSEAEDVRLMMKNINRYGSPNCLAEKWAMKIRDFFVEYAKTPTPKHHLNVIPGMFSHGLVNVYGETVPATPNGRFDKYPISHSNDPDPGFARGIDTFSPSLKATAVAKTQPGLGNSSPLHLDIDCDLIESHGGIEALMALIHTHNHMGGTLINLNCLTKKRLLEAHENPQSHPDLIVRVTGYSAFFASLSKEYRQQIVDRFLTNKG